MSSTKTTTILIIVLIIIAVIGSSFVLYKSQDKLRNFFDNTKGNVTITLQPADENFIPTEAQLLDTKIIIERRLNGKNILHHTITIDKDKGLILIKLKNTKENKDITNDSTFITELCDISKLTFTIVKETEYGTDGAVEYEYEGVHSYYLIEEEYMNGDRVAKAEAAYLNGEYVVNLKFDDEGAKTFGDVTSTHVGDLIGIFMDDTLVSVATVNSAITDGEGYISGNFTADETRELAATINSGSLPFAIKSVK